MRALYCETERGTSVSGDSVTRMVLRTFSPNHSTFSSTICHTNGYAPGIRGATQENFAVTSRPGATGKNAKGTLPSLRQTSESTGFCGPNWCNSPQVWLPLLRKIIVT